MKKYTRNITLFCLAILLSGSFVFGQSRLDMGKNPVAPKYNPGNITAAAFKTPKSKIVLNNKAVVGSFYRTKLMNNQKETSKNIQEQNIKIEESSPVSIGNIYPNPANDYSFLEYKNNANNYQVKVVFYDLLGRKVDDYILKNGEGKLNVDTRNWENGMYLYQLSIDNKKIATKKLLVRHF